MTKQKIYELRQAVDRAHKNYLDTRSEVARLAWKRLLEELRAAIEELQRERRGNA